MQIVPVKNAGEKKTSLHFLCPAMYNTRTKWNESE